MRLIPILSSSLPRLTAWPLRLLVVLALLHGLAPAPPRAPLEPPQQVVTTKPHLCMHTRLIDEVEEWKIQRSLQLIREMGASTIVEFFPWAYIETAEDVYDWYNVDRIVRHAQNQGLHVIARLGLVPEWVRRRDADNIGLTTLNTLPVSAYDDFSEFVADFARRYQGTIDHLIIWNEPNLAFEWGYEQVDPAGYAALLHEVYARAHEANPNVTILAAGLAPTLEPPGSPHGLNDVLYLEALYEAGAADSFDALAVHTYGFTHPPEAAPDPDALNFRRAELLREVMLRHGDEETPIYITESGWNDHPRWTHAVSPAERIEYTLDALALVESDWPWAKTLCLWVFRTPQPTLSYPDYFTFANTVFQLRPLYYEVQAYARSGAAATP
ncbi:MAG: beta-galactosidase [Chloroflexi bacterium]|nr:beta-galactosidase [Chloroflexota bacterium]